MNRSVGVFHRWLGVLLSTGLLMAGGGEASACCAVAQAGAHVVNADQSVILLWDQARQTQHFIRQADFRTDAAEVGFLVPSPSRPTLAESGNEAFARLREITAPRMREGGGFSIGCSVASPPSRQNVQVIEEKRVAGYDATVLTAQSGEALVAWLKNHGYAYSPAVAEWAKPYLGGSWHFTALKLAKKSASSGDPLKAAALRISFRTDRPIFPYREPESKNSAGALKVLDRLLRIHFIAETRYRGEIDGGGKWTGEVVWSGDITSHRAELLKSLQLPLTTGPTSWWLTQFDDRWPYTLAAGDLYFHPDPENRHAIPQQSAHDRGKDGTLLALLLVCGFRPFWRGWNREQSR